MTPQELHQICERHIGRGYWPGVLFYEGKLPLWYLCPNFSIDPHLATRLIIGSCVEWLQSLGRSVSFGWMSVDISNEQYPYVQVGINGTQFPSGSSIEALLLACESVWQAGQEGGG